MEAFKKWLEKNGIKYRSVEPWSLMFKGNHPDGVFIAIDGEDGEKLESMIIKTVKRGQVLTLACNHFEHVVREISFNGYDYTDDLTAPAEVEEVPAF